MGETESKVRIREEERVTPESADAATAPSSVWPAGVELTLRLILGGLFLYSGGAKLLDPAAFQVDVANFAVIPWTWTGPVAVVLPWLEIVCGAALVSRRFLDGGVLILSLLMILFIVLVASAWARGLDVSCGCFGASTEAPNYPLWIGRNILVLGGLIAIFGLGRIGAVESTKRASADDRSV